MDAILLPHQQEYFPAIYRKQMLGLRGIKFVLTVHPIATQLDVTKAQKDKIKKIAKKEAERLKRLSMKFEKQITRHVFSVICRNHKDAKALEVILSPGSDNTTGCPEAILRSLQVVPSSH